MTQAAAKTGVLLLGEAPLIRQAIGALLEGSGDLEVVAQASLKPPVTLLDGVAARVAVVAIAGSGPAGLAVLPVLASARPSMGRVVLAATEDRAFIERALAAGAEGYVLERDDPSALHTAITEVLRGRRYLSPGLGTAPPDPSAQPLTPREQEVLTLIAEGLTGRAIAAKLGLSPKTVENHRAHIASKLQLHGTAALVRYALSRER